MPEPVEMFVIGMFAIAAVLIGSIRLVYVWSRGIGRMLLSYMEGGLEKVEIIDLTSTLNFEKPKNKSYAFDDDGVLVEIYEDDHGYDGIDSQ